MAEVPLCIAVVMVANAVIVGIKVVASLGVPLNTPAHHALTTALSILPAAHHLLHTDHFGWQMPLSPNLDEDVRVIRKV